MPDHLRLAKTDAPPAARPADPPGFVETPTARDVLASVRLAYAAPGGDMTMIAGAPGVGKTAALRQFADAEETAAYLTVAPGEDAPFHLAERLWTLYPGECPKHVSNAWRKAQLVEFLSFNSMFLIFDEAQNAGRAGLDWLRMVGEEAGIGMVFAGSRDLAQLAGEMPQFSSRLSRPCLIRRGQPGDVAAIARAHGFADAESIRLLTDVSMLSGGLRNVVKVMALARLYRRNAPAAAEHLASAIVEMNLKPRRKK